jgi:hypothetical protein
MMRVWRPKAIRQMALEAARQRTPRGLIADVIDELWREQPAPMACLVRIHAAPQAAGQGHALERSRSWPSSRPTGSVRGRRRVPGERGMGLGRGFWTEQTWALARQVARCPTFGVLKSCASAAADHRRNCVAASTASQKYVTLNDLGRN